MKYKKFIYNLLIKKKKKLHYINKQFFFLKRIKL